MSEDTANNHQLDDSVKVINGDDDRYPKGSVGIVIEVDDDHYVVEFTDENGYIDEWYYSDYELEKVE